MKSLSLKVTCFLVFFGGASCIQILPKMTLNTRKRIKESGQRDVS